MDNKKQTSVEWFANEINAIVPPGHELEISFLLEKATQMADQERIDVYREALTEATKILEDSFKNWDIKY